jgi:hypothetical protein
MYMLPAIWIIQVFCKILRHYAKCQFFLGKVQKILLYVILQHFEVYKMLFLRQVHFLF